MVFAFSVTKVYLASSMQKQFPLKLFPINPSLPSLTLATTTSCMASTIQWSTGGSNLTHHTEEAYETGQREHKGWEVGGSPRFVEVLEVACPTEEVAGSTAAAASPLVLRDAAHLGESRLPLLDDPLLCCPSPSLPPSRGRMSHSFKFPFLRHAKKTGTKINKLGV